LERGDDHPYISSLGADRLEAIQPACHVLSRAAAVVTAAPMFSDPERLARAGVLAGYSRLTRDAYALDLRQSPLGAERGEVTFPA
jgi:hypothetical protein